MNSECVDVEIHKMSDLVDIGHWLDANMPNPPLPELQRWTLGWSDGGVRIGIKFSTPKDATLFMLRWG
jgi:hypothetical protein